MKLEKSGDWGESIHRTGHGQVGLQISLPIDPPRRAQCPSFGPERRKPLEGCSYVSPRRVSCWYRLSSSSSGLEDRIIHLKYSCYNSLPPDQRDPTQLRDRSYDSNYGRTTASHAAPEAGEKDHNSRAAKASGPRVSALLVR